MANTRFKNARWLHYDRALADGWPIATGVIEGACRYLVQDRMGRTGARWSLSGAEAVLRLRALRASGDFDDYWQFHVAKEHERTHASRYAERAVPNPLPASRSHLRLVKTAVSGYETRGESAPAFVMLPVPTNDRARDPRSDHASRRAPARGRRYRLS